MSGIRKLIRNHINWSEELFHKIKLLKNIEVITEPVLGLFTFRFINQNNENINELNEKIVKEINDEGLIYLTPTKVGEKFVIRFMAGTLEMEENDIDVAYECIKEKSERT